MPPSRRHQPVAAPVRGGGHAHDGLVEVHAAHRSVEGGVAEGEDAAVGRHRPVAAPVGGVGHAHHRLVEDDAAGRAAEGEVAEVEDAAVGRGQPIPARRSRRGMARHRETVVEIDGGHEHLSHPTARIAGARARPAGVGQPPVAGGVGEQRSPARAGHAPVRGQEGVGRLSARSERSRAGGQGLGVAGGLEVPRREEEVIGSAVGHELGIVDRGLPGQRGLVHGEEDRRRPEKARPVGTELHRPDLGRLRRTAVVRLPHQVGGAGGRVDERARVEHPARGAVEGTGGGVGEHRRTGAQRGGGGHRQAAVPAVGGVGIDRGVVEHDPPAVEGEHTGRRLGVGRLPRRGDGQRRRPVGEPGVRTPPGPRIAGGVDERLQVVPERGAGGEGVVGAGGGDDIRIGCVARERRGLAGGDGQMWLRPRGRGRAHRGCRTQAGEAEEEQGDAGQQAQPLAAG